MFKSYQLKAYSFTTVTHLPAYDSDVFTNIQRLWCLFACVVVGYFVYFDGYGVNYMNYTATPVNRMENQCLSFWYFMSGYVGTLTLYVTDRNGTRSAIWYRNDDHGTMWLQAEVDIPKEAFPLKEVWGADCSIAPSVCWCWEGTVGVGNRWDEGEFWSFH